MSSSCIPFTDVASETEDCLNSDRIGDVDKRGVQVLKAAEVDPVSPISQPDAGSLSHDPVCPTECFCGQYGQ